MTDLSLILLRKQGKILAWGTGQQLAHKLRKLPSQKLHLFSFEQKVAAKKGLKPTDEENTEELKAAKKEETRRMKKEEAQTNEATFGCEEEA